MPEVYEMIKRWPGSTWGRQLKYKQEQQQKPVDKYALVAEGEIYEPEMEEDVREVPETIEMSDENKLLEKQLTASYKDKLECGDELSEESDDYMYDAEREQERKRKRR